MLLNCLDKSI